MNKKYLAFIGVLAAVLFLVQYRMPIRFSWKETFSHYGYQPFGCAVFDSVVACSMPKGYTVTCQTLRQLHRDGQGPRSLIVLSRAGHDFDTYSAYAREGWRVLILNCNNWDVDLDSAYLESKTRLDTYYFAPEKIIKEGYRKVQLHWENKDDGYAGQAADFYVLDRLVEETFHIKKAPGHSVLASVIEENGERHPIAVSIPMGKGEVIAVSAPLLFTNYGMLHDDSRRLVARVLNRLTDMHVVRMDETMKEYDGRNTSTPLIVFLERPPLQLAIYLTVGTLLLFMFCTARRRQRVIPVMEPPQNNNLEFVKLIGSLYYQRGDNRGLLQKKLTYTTEKLRRLTGIDLQSESDAAERLATRLGMTAAEVQKTISEVNTACQTDTPLPAAELSRLIRRLNDLLKQI